MSFSILDAHQSIGWDFDGTLDGHKKSAKMHAYIRRNPNKKHYIVTFRSHGMQHDVWSDLVDRYEERALQSRNFVAVLNIPDKLYEMYRMAQRMPSGPARDAAII